MASADQPKDLVTEVRGDEVVQPRTAGMGLIVVLMLAVDDLNPVKILCSYSNGVVCARHVACIAAFALVVLGINQAQFLLYYCIKLFLRSTLNNVFFRSVEIIGTENLPKHGPVILTGNHNNQFVDGALLLTNCRRKISFMIAEKSWKRPFVGFLARAFHSIPVARPQDIVKKGAGTIASDGSTTIRGHGTRFSEQVTAGSSLLVTVSGEEKVLKVVNVISDSELSLAAAVPDLPDSQSEYKIMPKIDQNAMYDAVFQCLGEGKCLGIFPEGGSHDRTDLLPLKAGVAIIALDAYRKHHIRVPIVPVGLNYFRGHHFRGRVVVEFGAPIRIDDALYELHETDRREATDSLLKIVATGMRSTIVPVPDYRTLQIVYMVRRLYQQDGLKLTADQTMDLNRRFAEGIRRLGGMLQESQRGTDDNPSALDSDQSNGAAPLATGKTPEEMEQFYQKLEDVKTDLVGYMSALKKLGLRDYQVSQMQWWGIDHLVGRLVYVTVMLGLGGIPQLMFNLPVGLAARALAASEQKKALKASSVKLAARDVLMSYKIIYVLCMVPVLYVVYIVMLCCFLGFTRTTFLLTAAAPLFSFFGVKASEQGIRAYGDLVPLVMRLLPSSRAEQDKLPARRATLQMSVRRTVRIAGPLLGDLYKAEHVDWMKEAPSENQQWPAMNEILDNSPKPTSGKTEMKKSK